MRHKAMLKKASVVVLVVMLLLPFFMGKSGFQTAYAEDVWTEITNAGELDAIRHNPSGKYKLMADIDLEGVAWSPIGSSVSPFTGTLDGNSKVIRNLSIIETSSADKGLFGVIGTGGKVLNLGMENASITAANNAGLLVGTNEGHIERCYVKGSVTGHKNVGGLSGRNSGSILNAFASAFVSGQENIGGLVGSNSGTVEKCYSSSEIAASLFNNYLEFDGVSGYVRIPDDPDNPIYNTDKFTLEAWFQWDQVDTAEIDFIVGKGFERFEIHTGGESLTNGIRFIPIPNQARDSYLDALDVMQPGWFHVAAVYDFTTGHARVFINGVAQPLWQKGFNVGTTAILERIENPLSQNIDDFNIGRRTDNSYYFKGKISDVRFWNVARTAEQIAADMNRQLAGTESGLIGYWKLDEPDGEIAYDSSTILNNGTLVDGVTRVQVAVADRGGLIGQNTGTGTVLNSYYDSNVSGLSDVGKGAPKTTSEMKQSTTFADWTAFWGFASGINDGYPYLLATSKDITAFSFAGLDPVVNGSVNQSAKTISLIVPHDTELEALTPTIVHTGASVSPNTGVTQDFSGGVTYTVTAQDGSTTAYTVTVTKWFTLNYAAGANGTVTGDLSQPVNQGESGTAVTAAPNTGYHFVKWSDDISTASRTDTNVAANVDVTAEFAGNTYTVSFNADSGSVTPDTQNKLFGSTYGKAADGTDAALPTPAKEGYTFDGWWTGAGGTGTEVTNATPVTTATDHTLHAKWTANTYTVTFNAEGGSVTPATQSKLFGSTYGKSSDGTSDALPTSTKAGHTFGGWWTGAGGTGTLVTDTTQVTTASNHTLYAKWTSNAYTVAFNADGGSVTPTTQDKLFGSTYGKAADGTDAALPTPTKVGHTFGGWWTGAGGTGTEVTNAMQVTTASNHTLYAKWTANTYTVTFNADGGSVTPVSQDKLFGSTYGKEADGTTNEALPTPTKAGHTFGGWWTGAGGTGTSVTDATQVTTASNHTLYAKWTANVYTVTFDADGGSVSPASQSKLFGFTYGKEADGTTNAALPAPTKAGHTFGGWWTGAGGTGTEVTNAMQVTTASNHTLYAKWTATKYNVTYSGNGSTGGTAPADNVQYSYNDEVTVQSQGSLVKNGHRFIGWNTAANGSGTSRTAGSKFNITDSQMLYAQWAANIYAVTFDADGGSVSPSHQNKLFESNYGQAPGGAIESLPMPAKPGYAFGGWWTGKSGTGTEINNTSAVTTASDHTLYAKWAKIPVASVELNAISLTLTRNQSATLYATVSPANAADTQVKWLSSNTGVATVDQSGKVTAVSVGSATITATADGISATCSVTVRSVTSSSTAAPTPTAAPTSTPITTPAASARPTASAQPTPSPEASPGSSAAPLPRVSPAAAVKLTPAQVEKDEQTGVIYIEVHKDQLPEGTTTIRTASGKVIHIGDDDVFRIEISQDELDEAGALEFYVLDDEETPFGVVSMQVSDSGGLGGIWQVLIWIAMGLVAAGVLAGVIAIVFIKRKQKNAE